MKHFILLAFLAFSSVFFSQNTDSLIPINLKDEIPSKIDLRSKFTEVKDQGYRAACGYFAVASIIESEFRKYGKYINISEQYLIYATKQTVEKKRDEQKREASYVWNNLETAIKYGVMQEYHWPYQSSWFDFGYPCHGMNQDESAPVYCYSENRPPKEMYDSKIKFSGEFVHCPANIDHILVQVGKNEKPLILLFPLYSEQYQKVTNHLEWNDSVQKLWRNSGEGYHYFVIYGYDVSKQLFYLRNSWGKEWGDKGYCTISFYDMMRYLGSNLLGFNLTNPEEIMSVKVIKDKDVKVHYFHNKFKIMADKSLQVKVRSNISDLGNHALLFKSLLVCQPIESKLPVSDSTIIEVKLNAEDQQNLKMNMFEEDGFIFLTLILAMVNGKIIS